MDLEYGDILFFNGNKCTHYNMKNQEENVRISLDFRILPFSAYRPEKSKQFHLTSSKPYFELF